jgi:hypothetical protein
MVDRELWHYDINTDDLRQIEVDLNRIKSLDSSYYVVWTVDNVISPVRTHYDYFLHNSDGSPVDNYHVIPFNEAQPDNVICWRPDDRGFVYHHLHTEIAQYANDLYYYDVKENQSHHLLDLGLRNDFRGVSWSPQGRYLLIFTENQLLLYDMQTDSTRNLDVESNSLLGWDSRVGCRGFPYYVFRG